MEEKNPMMIDLNEFLWNFSLISLILRSFILLRKAICMALFSNSSPSSSHISWMGFQSPVSALRDVCFTSVNRPQENSGNETYPTENLRSKSPVLVDSCSRKYPQVDLDSGSSDLIPKGAIFVGSNQNPDEILQFGPRNSVENDVILVRKELPQAIPAISMRDGVNSMVACEAEVKVLGNGKARKRPARIVIPQLESDLGFGEVGLDAGEGEFQVEGRNFYLASKKGRRKVMEDGYGVITDICGNSKQAFFGVFDGHGGHAAMDYVAEKLGTNIITAIGEFEKAENQLELAIRAGYLATDKEFLSQGVSSGTCAATVLLKDEELHVSNVGDCRVILSRNGIASALTNDHCVDREDERFRIESSGGYVNCHKGVWRVQGSLAVSRAIGDAHLKEWIISEPETKKLRLTSDCEFLIMASDGLWDKVTNQEAVDVVLRHKDSIESCKKLVDISFSRGSKDDITVMVINLQNFTHIEG